MKIKISFAKDLISNIILETQNSGRVPFPSLLQKVNEKTGLFENIKVLNELAEAVKKIDNLEEFLITIHNIHQHSHYILATKLSKFFQITLNMTGYHKTNPQTVDLIKEFCNNDHDYTDTTSTENVLSEQNSEFKKIPDELILHIFSYVPKPNNISLVNKRWLRLYTDFQTPKFNAGNFCTSFNTDAPIKNFIVLKDHLSQLNTDFTNTKSIKHNISKHLKLTKSENSLLKKIEEVALKLKTIYLLERLFDTCLYHFKNDDFNNYIRNILEFNKTINANLNNAGADDLMPLFIAGQLLSLSKVKDNHLLKNIFLFWKNIYSAIDDDEISSLFSNELLEPFRGGVLSYTLCTTVSAMKYIQDNFRNDVNQDMVIPDAIVQANKEAIASLIIYSALTDVDIKTSFDFIEKLVSDILKNNISMKENLLNHTIKILKDLVSKCDANNLELAKSSINKLKKSIRHEKEFEQSIKILKEELKNKIQIYNAKIEFDHVESSRHFPITTEKNSHEHENKILLESLLDKIENFVKNFPDKLLKNKAYEQLTQYTSSVHDYLKSPKLINDFSEQICTILGDLLNKLNKEVKENHLSREILLQVQDCIHHVLNTLTTIERLKHQTLSSSYSKL